MIALFKFISVLVEVVRQVMDYLNTRRLIEAGKKEQQAEELVEQEKRSEVAKNLVKPGHRVDRKWLRRSKTTDNQ